MKIKSLFIQAALLGAALTCGTALRANNNIAPTQTLRGGDTSNGFQTVGFGDTAEAKTLRDVYITLATGDHDYNGHRAAAMTHVKAAADLLGLDLGGDARARQPQALSDDKMRESKAMILQVMDAAEVKDQKKVVKHLEEAVHEINVSLGIK